MAGPLPTRVLPSGEGVGGRGADDKGRTAALLVKKYRPGDTGRFNLCRRPCSGTKGSRSRRRRYCGVQGRCSDLASLERERRTAHEVRARRDAVRGAPGTTEPHIMVSTPQTLWCCPRKNIVMSEAFSWRPRLHTFHDAQHSRRDASGASPARAERGFGGGKPRAAPKARARRVGAAMPAEPAQAPPCIAILWASWRFPGDFHAPILKNIRPTDRRIRLFSAPTAFSAGN
jgi:hypothetical protein